MTELALTAGPEDAGERIDRFVSARRPELTRSAVQKLCAEGGILVGGRPVEKNYKLRPGDSEVTLRIPAPKPLEAIAQEIALDVVFEDDQLIVINKPKGLVVHPAPGHEDGTLVNALLHHCGDSLQGIGGVLRPGIVHRIDKDTSGLLVAAKTEAAHEALSRQVKAHSFTRIYEAVVHGNLREDVGTVDAPIARHPRERKRMCVLQAGGREAVTHYQVLGRYRGFTHAALRLETGRTHQIRVHMAYLSHPVAGDPVYGPGSGKRGLTARLEGQCLHARRLGFDHPARGERLEFETDLPDYFTRFLRGLTEQ